MMMLNKAQKCDKKYSLKRLAGCIVDIPYKCPPALINDMLIKNGTRRCIDLDIYVPTSISLPVTGVTVTQDVVNLHTVRMLIYFHPLHKLKKVLDKETLEFENGDKINYDLLILIPPHQIPKVIRNSTLLGGHDWTKADKFIFEQTTKMSCDRRCHGNYSQPEYCHSQSRNICVGRGKGCKSTNNK
jgi:hypothetical protein